MKWEELTEEEFPEAIKKSGGVCVLPLGCLEKHGQHLPVGTDYIEALDAVTEAAKLEDAVIFPTGAWLGDVSCFHAFKNPGDVRLRGCVGIKQSTLVTVLKEICDEIARNGFNKILIANGHGGNNTLINALMSEQTYNGQSYATMSTFAFAFSDFLPMRLMEIIQTRRDEFSFVTKADLETLKKHAERGYGGGHADFRETCMVMANNEHLVAPERYDAESGHSTKKSTPLSDLGVNAPNSWLANYPNSYAAFAPYGASSTLGRAMLKISAERLAKIFRVLKEDKIALEISNPDDIFK